MEALYCDLNSKCRTKLAWARFFVVSVNSVPKAVTSISVFSSKASFLRSINQNQCVITTKVRSLLANFLYLETLCESKAWNLSQQRSDHIRSCPETLEDVPTTCFGKTQLWPSKMMMYFSCHLLLEVYLCLESESVEAVILLLRINSLLDITCFLTNSTWMQMALSISVKMALVIGSDTHQGADLFSFVGQVGFEWGWNGFFGVNNGPTMSQISSIGQRAELAL